MLVALTAGMRWVRTGVQWENGYFHQHAEEPNSLRDEGHTIINSSRSVWWHDDAREYSDR